MAYSIPAELISMLKERRVIPFIGAGFSAALKLPGWDELLSAIVDRIGIQLSYEELRTQCNGDPLQIAEYLFLKSDKSIGPLRHQISNLLHTTECPVGSSYHVELLNLNAPQIYTTNFDELIEQTFRHLGEPADVVSLPKHIAQSSTNRVQIVKYHGDLQHESTLVLTESSYYTRLDFESPMDLKFRSDLLGRSVLFMGYSFRDINIRIIWFKLMQMMKDIPPADRFTSYIVRYEANAALELLYDAVGIKTIVLDPAGEAQTNDDRRILFEKFLLDLSMRTSSEKAQMPGSGRAMFTSKRLLLQVQRESELLRSRRQPFFGMRAAWSEVLAWRRLPRQLKVHALETLAACVKGRFDVALARFSVSCAREYGASAIVSFAIAVSLLTEETREVAIGETIWDCALKEPISIDHANELVRRLAQEVETHSRYPAEDRDEDLASISLARGTRAR